MCLPTLLSLGIQQEYSGRLLKNSTLKRTPSCFFSPQVTIRTRRYRGLPWPRHFFYRKESIRTTWKFRLALLLLIMLLVSVTRGFWMLKIGQSLVCAEEISPSDVILVENFDPNYLVFERAAALYKVGFAARVLVPTAASRDPERANPVSQGIAELMARDGAVAESGRSFPYGYSNLSVLMPPIRSGTF